MELELHISSVTNLLQKQIFHILQGTEWYATDTNQYNLNQAGTPDTVIPFENQPAHDGLNIYGDEVSLAALGSNLNDVGQSLEALD